jgi:hypothetical protein
MEIADRFNDDEARRFLGCTPRVLKELRRRRLITFYKVGHRSVAYDRPSLERYLKARKVPAIGEASR